MASYHDAVGGDGSVVVDDLTEGSNEWRNIQDIVRLTFKAFHDVLRAQGDAIQRLEASAEGRGPAGGDVADLARRVAGMERHLSEVDSRLERCATRADLERASAATRAELDEMMRSLRGEESSSRSLADARLASRQYATKDEIRAKADMRDVVSLVDEKVGLDEVNRAFADVSKALEDKASVAALEASIREQGVVNRGLSAESSVGRWIWKSGACKSGGAVPWNVESVNTDPQNFRWAPDKAVIQTVAPGLYEVTFGFFTRKKPAVQLLVNGDPVLAAVNSASYVLHHSSGRLTSVGRHPAGNVTGLTLIDFIALPPKAKIAVTSAGERGGEGFLSLKKL